MVYGTGSGAHTVGLSISCWRRWTTATCKPRLKNSFRIKLSQTYQPFRHVFGGSARKKTPGLLEALAPCLSECYFPFFFQIQFLHVLQVSSHKILSQLRGTIGGALSTAAVLRIGVAGLALDWLSEILVELLQCLGVRHGKHADPALTSTSKEGDTPVASTVASAAASAASARLAWHGRRHECKNSVGWRLRLYVSAVKVCKHDSNILCKDASCQKYSNLDFGEVGEALFGLESWVALLPWYFGAPCRKSWLIQTITGGGKRMFRNVKKAITEGPHSEAKWGIQWGNAQSVTKSWRLRAPILFCEDNDSKSSRSKPRITFEGSATQQFSAKSIARNEHRRWITLIVFAYSRNVQEDKSKKSMHAPQICDLMREDGRDSCQLWEWRGGKRGIAMAPRCRQWCLRHWRENDATLFLSSVLDIQIIQLVVLWWQIFESRK